MFIVAKVITVIISVKGIILLLDPLIAGEAADFFDALSTTAARIFGLLYIIAGAALFYLIQQSLSRMTVHWIVAVTGIYTALWGIVITLSPGLFVRIIKWFYGDTAGTRAAGLMLLVLGTGLFLLL